MSVNLLLFQCSRLLVEKCLFLLTFVFGSPCLERKTHCGALLVSQVTVMALIHIGRRDPHQLWAGSELGPSGDLQMVVLTTARTGVT